MDNGEKKSLGFEEGGEIARTTLPPLGGAAVTEMDASQGTAPSEFGHSALPQTPSSGIDPDLAREIAGAQRPEGVSPGPDSLGPGIELAPYPATSGANTFLEPLAGKVTSKFSVNPRIDGITVMGKPGSAVKASQGGQVLACQENFEKLGNVLILKHPDKSISAYGHLKKFAVSKGATVQQGDVIGSVGDKGRLYFEVRKVVKANGRPQPVNPSSVGLYK
jgi:murein DD-endopeptidase MepM/ murein hydrolase activator NlpD